MALPAAAAESQQEKIDRIQARHAHLMQQVPRDWSAIYECGVDLFKIGAFSEALEIADGIMEDNAGWFKREFVYLLQSKCQFKLGYTLKSRSTLLECLQINPNLEEALEWQKEREAVVISEGQKMLWWTVALAAAGLLYLGYKTSQRRAAAGLQ